MNSPFLPFKPPLWACSDTPISESIPGAENWWRQPPMSRMRVITSAASASGSSSERGNVNLEVSFFFAMLTHQNSWSSLFTGLIKCCVLYFVSVTHGRNIFPWILTELCSRNLHSFYSKCSAVFVKECRLRRDSGTTTAEHSNGCQTFPLYNCACRWGQILHWLRLTITTIFRSNLWTAGRGCWLKVI